LETRAATRADTRATEANRIARGRGACAATRRSWVATAWCSATAARTRTSTEDFCLGSDSGLHINAHFIGKRPDGRTRDFTWVQALGFVFGRHTLTIAARKVAQWDKSVDQLLVAYNWQGPC
jgi:hypothetical protein